VPIERGGHFLAAENPGLFAAQLRATFRGDGSNLPGSGPGSP
jgi:hypothetical protein